MTENHADHSYETKRLKHTVDLARKRLEQARRDGEIHMEEIAKDREHAREYTSSWMAGSFATGDFEDIVEASQYESPIRQRLALYELSKNRLALMERLVSSPYFARVDFRFDDNDNTRENIEKVYIGYGSLMEENSSAMAVYDWRSPIASVFYGFATGPAYYDAPSGRIRGELSLKRQYEIRDGKLEFFFDADVQIVDEFLRNLLSQNAAPAMKTIVETIQKEQDAIIRDMGNDVMMVQGVAGSGKTSVALHRAAYLMYSGLSSSLSANQIMILSPNTMFERYISEVLPGLGEENTRSAVADELFASILQPLRIQTKERFLELLYSNSLGSDGVKRRARLKTSEVMTRVIDRFADDIQNKWIEYKDICFGAYQIASGDELRRRVNAGVTGRPLAYRLNAVREDLLDTARAVNARRPNREEYARVKAEIERFAGLDIDAVYGRLFADEAYFKDLARECGADDIDAFDELFLPANAPRTASLSKQRAGIIPYDDAAVLSYLKIKLFGAKGFDGVNHVLIDEAQDYNPLHFAIFGALFANAKFTILGDVNQTLEKTEDMSLYDKISAILRREKTAIAVMNKSFRCTNEILRFGARFLSGDADIQSFNRQGREPEIRVAKDRAELRVLIAREIKECFDAGYKSVGLLCKSAKNATALYRDLGGVADTGVADEGAIVLDLITSGKSANPRGAFIMPVYLSKGMEFDAALICDADDKNYYSEDDKKLLYIACTRALHRLNVYCVGKASDLLADTGERYARN